MNYVIYASTSVSLLTDDELLERLETYRNANIEHGITGLLMYHDGNWIQYIEGEAVGQLYENIRADVTHKGIITLDEGSVTDRLFPDWAMGYQPEKPEDHEAVTAFFELNGEEIDRRMTPDMPASVDTMLRNFYRLGNRFSDGS